ncbi:hypothetical protein GOODEAATRI_020167, partial [Goodea atripinnis]
AKFCSTVANDIMLETGFGVVRMWADETSRLSRFRMLFTIFSDQELLSLQALRRSSSGSRCVHEHHCGSEASINSIKPIHGSYVLGKGSLELPPCRRDSRTTAPPFRDMNSSLRKKSWPGSKQSRMQSHPAIGDRVLWRQDRVMEEDEEEEGRYDLYVRRAGGRREKYDMAHQRSQSMDF